MIPLPFVWPYALLFWVAYVFSFAPEFRFVRRARTDSSPSTDRGSLQLILAAMQLAMLVAFVIAFFVPPIRWHRTAVFVTGLFMLLGGSLVRRHCFRVLGEHFTYAVIVEKEQPVIERGAYKWVRHPSYTGGALMFTGLGVALGNWASIAILLVAAISVYGYRVRVEERALMETIGDPYRDYMKRTVRFIPFVF